ncbi:MAG: tetratricopeptide repeat protein [Betaproteobacteria bacterium]|nr:tetratricopeptide repeat protein [Betaproteobacteria bacterium]
MARTQLNRWVAALAGLALAGCAAQPPLLSLSAQAQAAYSQGDIRRALPDYQKLTAADPDNPVLWTRLGNLYAHEGRPKDALHAYRRAIRLDPQDGEAWYNLGLVHLKQSQAIFVQAYALLPANDPARARIESLLAATASLSAGTRRHPPGTQGGMVAAKQHTDHGRLP